MSANDEYSFGAGIAAVLAKHPDWLGTALKAVTSGLHAAIEAERERCSKSDMAMLAALSLVESKRIDPKLREMLAAPIMRALPARGGSPVELEFARKHALLEPTA